ncbi:hypothetical protein, partial [Aquamicrobium sp.]|uniref:hypothetical protein n=1 Tax=Aquamicrobium sp. TaxID=1872579 RepID=UPI0025898ED7
KDLLFSHGTAFYTTLQNRPGISHLLVFTILTNLQPQSVKRNTDFPLFSAENPGFSRLYRTAM